MDYTENIKQGNGNENVTVKQFFYMWKGTIGVLWKNEEEM